MALYGCRMPLFADMVKQHQINKNRDIFRQVKPHQINKNRDLFRQHFDLSGSGVCNLLIHNMADTKPLHQTRFEAAVNVIQSLPKNGSFQPSNEMMLKFYSFYKQATQGPCNIQRPGFWDPVGRYKWVNIGLLSAARRLVTRYLPWLPGDFGIIGRWRAVCVTALQRPHNDLNSDASAIGIVVHIAAADAWNSLGDMSKEDAMIAYVDEMKKILESMPMTEKVEELLHVIGPFYEIVEEKKTWARIWCHFRLAKLHLRLDKVTKSLEDLSSALTSTPNCKAVNGKAESSDSGAESEEEENGGQEEEEEGEDEAELSEK
ncbi:unnamed protein product, partial [Ranitomeya imitator]